MAGGYVYKRGDAWRIRWDIGPGPDGKRRQRSRTCRGMSKRQAQIELDRIMLELRIDTKEYRREREYRLGSLRYEPVPPLTIYRAGGQVEVILGSAPKLVEQHSDVDLISAGKWQGLSILEADLPGDIQAVYTTAAEGQELLVWQKSLDPAERAAVIGLPSGIRWSEQ